MEKIKVKFIGDSLRNPVSVKVKRGTSVLDAAIKGGVEIDAPCGGKNRCGKCIVKVNSQRVLACSTKIFHDIIVEVESQTARILKDLAISNFEVNHSFRIKNLDGSSVLMRDGEILGYTNDLYGVSLDIGTTTLSGYLVDLKNGVLMDKKSITNPQVSFGADVISRISYAIKNGRHELTNFLLKGINQLIRELCKNDVDPSSIYYSTVVGNSVMHHFLLGLDTKNLGFYPYKPLIKKGTEKKAKDIGISINPSGYVYFLPLVNGHVGSDALGMIIALEIHKSNETCLAIDLGTNGEIIIGNKKKILACSSAAGPAFEGTNISSGMRATDGAIERVWKNFGYKTIGNKPARGICGSGLIDAIAEMLKSGIINRNGKLLKEFSIGGIRITQRDIREFQLAKAAIRTGIDILVNMLEPPKKIYISGAFGNYIDRENAIYLGLLPQSKHIFYAGNAAGLGAIKSMLSDSIKKEAEEIAEKIEYIELSTQPEFESIFMKNIRFGEYA
ncbi:MAG: ASKHA domain-containing protein [Candidatus Hydrothermarchaeota archaeon]